MKSRKNGYTSCKAKNTITRSYGNSNQIETAAFMIMALLRGQYARYVSEGVEYILSQRNRGRFGSTQATCMALKALLEYNRKFKVQSNKEHEILIHINDQLVKGRWHKNENNNLTLSNLEDYLVDGQNQVDVIWEGEQTLAYDFTAKWKSDLSSTNQNVKVNL